MKEDQKLSVTQDKFVRTWAVRVMTSLQGEMSREDGLAQFETLKHPFLGGKRSHSAEYSVGMRSSAVGRGYVGEPKEEFQESPKYERELMFFMQTAILVYSYIMRSLEKVVGGVINIIQ